MAFIYSRVDLEVCIIYLKLFFEFFFLFGLEFSEFFDHVLSRNKDCGKIFGGR